MVVHNLNPTLVARYFFFECPRYLGLSSLPLGTRQVCRLPPGQQRPSIAARFLPSRESAGRRRSSARRSPTGSG